MLTLARACFKNLKEPPESPRLFRSPSALSAGAGQSALSVSLTARVTPRRRLPFGPCQVEPFLRDVSESMVCGR